MVVLTVLAAGPACAESLAPDAARRFVAGKLFAFNCFDSSHGAGRIYGDGSVIGTVQFRGAGPARTVGFVLGNSHECQVNDHRGAKETPLGVGVGQMNGVAS